METSIEVIPVVEEVKVQEHVPTKQEMALKIAEDVLLQLKINNIIARASNGYVNSPREFSTIQKDDDPARENIELFDNCSVCAIGACMVSMVRLYNTATVGQLRRCTSEMWDKLAGVFSVDEIVAMEYCFEGWDAVHGSADRYDYDLNLSLTERTTDFYNRYANDTERLEKIMLNIVANHGSFVI